MRQMQAVMSKRRDKTDYPALQYVWQNNLVKRMEFKKNISLMPLTLYIKSCTIR
jgi:hypothetical protein